MIRFTVSRYIRIEIGSHRRPIVLEEYRAGRWRRRVFFGDRSSRFFTRLADMINVLLSRRWGSSRIGIGAIGLLSGGLVFLAPSPTMAQTQPPAAKASPATPDTAKEKDAADDAQAPDVAPVPVADPSQTRKVATIEVFKDPNIEAFQLLDASKFRPLPISPFTPTELLSVKEMAGNKNIPPDPQLINRVVKGLAAKLTDRAGIQALVEMPEDDAVPAGAAKDAIKKANADAAPRGAKPPRPSRRRPRISWSRSSRPGPSIIATSSGITRGPSTSGCRRSWGII